MKEICGESKSSLDVRGMIGRDILETDIDATETEREIGAEIETDTGTGGGIEADLEVVVQNDSEEDLEFAMNCLSSNRNVL